MINLVDPFNPPHGLDERVPSCYDYQSKEKIAECEKGNAAMGVVVGLLAVPLVLVEGVKALHARTWKECAHHLAIATVVGVVALFCFTSGTSILNQYK